MLDDDELDDGTPFLVMELLEGAPLEAFLQDDKTLTLAQVLFAADQVLDVKGLDCPQPILRTKLALARMQPGEVIHVLATDPHSTLDFKAYCARTGHELVHLESGDGLFQFYVRRAG